MSVLPSLTFYIEWRRRADSQEIIIEFDAYFTVSEFIRLFLTLVQVSKLVCKTKVLGALHF